MANLSESFDNVNLIWQNSFNSFKNPPHYILNSAPGSERCPFWFSVISSAFFFGECLNKVVHRILRSLVASAVLISFTAVQVLPQVWADTIPLEQQIQDQTPTAPIGSASTQSEATSPDTSTDFLMGSGSVLSEASGSSEGVSSFSDDFNRTSLGSDWTVIRGNYGISSNTLYGYGSFPVNDGGAVLNQELSVSDYDISVSTYYVNGGSVTPRGILARYQDLNNYYYAKVSRFGQASIIKKQGGVLTTLVSGSISGVNQDAWNTIRLVAEGNDLKLYFNGASSPQLTAHDTVNPLTSGKVGVYADSYGEKFDNFSVTAIQPTVTPPASPTVNALPQFTNQTTLTLSGTKPTNTSIWINGIERVSLNSSTAWSYIAALSEGLNSFQVITKDNLGNGSASIGISTTRDTVSPTGSININSGASSTSLTQVTLNLSANDSGSGINQMSFSTDNNIWSSPEAYVPSKIFIFQEGDGIKTIYVKYFDQAGNVSQVYSSQITLSAPPVLLHPTGSIQINQGLEITTNHNVRLVLAAQSDVLPGDFNHDGSVDAADYVIARKAGGAQYDLWRANFGKTLPQIPGDFNRDGSVDAADYVMARKAGGAQYDLWRSNFGKTYAITQMSFSFDGTNWMPPEPYRTSKTLTLPDGDGAKTIYVKFYDGLGNESEVYSDSIVLNTQASLLDVNFQSSRYVTAPNYELVYQVNGIESRQNYVLKEGANLLEVEVDYEGLTHHFHYLVILNDLPDLSLQTSSASLQLSNGQIDATLYNFEFQGGEIWNGIFQVNTGDWYRIEEGILREVMRPDGIHTFFANDGKVAAIVFAPNKIMDFGYRMIPGSGVVETILEDEDEIYVLDSENRISKLITSTGDLIVFAGDRLSEIHKSSGHHIFYSSQLTSSGYLVSLQRIENAAGDRLIFLNEIPVEAFNNAGTPLTLSPGLLETFGWNEQTNLATKLTYNSSEDLIKFITSQNLTFEIMNGAISRVLDSNNVETTYNLANDPLAFNTGLAVLRESLTRTYGIDGSLFSLALQDGTVIEYENETPFKITKQDGSFFTDLRFNAAGELQDAVYHTPDGWHYSYVNRVLVESISPDNLKRVYDNLGKIIGLETGEGKLYSYIPTTYQGGPVIEALLTEFKLADGTRVLVDSNQRVMAQIFTDGSRLDYSYGPDTKISQVSASRITDTGLVLLETYLYSYEDGKTIVEDSGGRKRTYDAEGNIQELSLPDGKKYCYVPAGDDGFIQSLCEIQTDGFGKTVYGNGYPVSIELESGTVNNISGIVLDILNQIQSATVSYSDGLIGLIQNGQLSQLFEPGGLGHQFENGILVKIFEADGTETDVTYQYDSSQNLLSISLTNSGITRIYSPDGTLIQVILANGVIFNYVNDILTEAFNSNGDKFYFASNGTLTGLDLVDGSILRNATFNPSGQLLSGTLTIPGGEIRIILGGIIVEVRKPSGVKLFYTSGIITRVEEPDGDKLFYTNGALTRVEKSNGEYLIPTSLDLTDHIITGQIYLNRNGRIARRTGEVLPNGMRSFENGSIKEPSGTVESISQSQAQYLFGGSTTSFVGTVLLGEFVFQTNNSTAVEWDGMKVTLSPSITGAKYFKVNLASISGSISQIRFNGQTYSYDDPGTYYFELPQGNVSSLTITFPVGPPQGTRTGLSITGMELVGEDVQNAQEWTIGGSDYIQNKLAPLISSQVHSALSQAALLEADSPNYLKPFSFTARDLSNEAWRVDEATQIVQGTLRSQNSFIAARYDQQGTLQQVLRLGSSQMEMPTTQDLLLDETKFWHHIDLVQTLLPALSEDTVFKMHFSDAGQLLTAWRINTEEAHFDGGKLKRLITPDGKLIEYGYTGDSAESFNHLMFTPDPGKQISIDYDIGAIRSVSQNGNQIYDYSYEFNLGNQTTVVHEIETNEIRRYQDDLLWSVTDMDTGMETKYTYDEQGRVKTAVVSRAGRIFGTYQYSYLGDETLIQDNSGTTRVYDTQGIIKRLITASGEYYDYTSIEEEPGKILILQELSMIKDAALGEISYVDGLPTAIIRPDGSVLSDIVLDENYRLLSARATYFDGALGIIENGQLIRLTKPDGAVHFFQDGELFEIHETNGTISTLTYMRDGAQNITSISILNNGVTRKYNAQGMLIQVNAIDGTIFDYTGGILTSALTTSGDRFNFAPDGTLTSFSLSSGVSVSGAFNSGGQLVSGTINLPGGDQYIVTNTVITEVRKPNGTKFFYTNNFLTRIEEPDKDQLFYTNGILTRIERYQGPGTPPDVITPITTGASDQILTAWIQYPGQSGRIAKTSGEVLQDGLRFFSSGSVAEPGTLLATVTSFTPVFGGGTTSFVGNSSQGQFIFQSNNSTSVEWDGAIRVNPAPYTSNARYLKVRLDSIGGVNPPSQINIEVRQFSGSGVVLNQTYAYNGSGVYYFEMPEGNPELRVVKITFPVGPPQGTRTGLSIQEVEFRDIQIRNESSVTGMASSYSSNKNAPSFPTQISAALPQAQILWNQSLNYSVQFELTPSDLEQATSRYDTAQSWLNGTIPSDDFVISAAFEGSGVVARIVRGDGTVTSYENGQVKQIETKDGDLITSYDYDVNGDLLAVHLAESRRNFPFEVQKAKADLQRQKIELLAQLAQQGQAAVDQVLAQYHSGLSQINAQRQAINDARFQKVCKSYFFWKTCEIVEVNIPNYDQLMADLAEQERQLTQEKEAAMIEIDGQLAVQKAQIEADAVVAFHELELEAAKLYRDLIRQELSPVIYHHYRVVLGRDPSIDEVNAWLDHEVGDQDLSLQSLIESATFHDLVVQATRINYDELKRLIDTYGKPILVRMSDEVYIIVTDITLEEDPPGSGNFVEKVSIIERNLTPDSANVKLTRDEFINRWFEDGQTEGVILKGGSEVVNGAPLTQAEAEAITGKGYWDTIVKFFDLALALDLEKIDVVKLRTYLSGSAEYDKRLREVRDIRAQVEAFLLEYVDATDARQVQMEESIGLYKNPTDPNRQPDNIIPLPRSEIDEILKWLKSGDLHFGQSATLALQRIITSEGYIPKGLNPAGLSQDFIDITRDTILIDILVGAIHPLSQGDLELSVFSLVRYAQHHGITVYQAKIDLDELKRQLDLGKEVIVHVNGNHFIVVTQIIGDEVTYYEINVGPEGGLYTKTLDEFIEIWDGVVISAVNPSDPSTLLTDAEAQEVTGAGVLSWLWDLVKGIFTGFVNAITSIVHFITNVIEAMVSIVKTVIEFTLNAIIKIGEGLINFGRRIFEGVKLVGSFILKGIKAGFQFLKNAVSHFGQFLSLGIAGFIAGGPLGFIAGLILAPVVNLGLNYGLRALGVPDLAREIILSFAQGAILGALNPIGGIGVLQGAIKGGISVLTGQALTLLGQVFHLPPILTTTISNLGSFLTNNFIGSDLSALETFRNVMPTVVRELGLAGISLLGDKLGLPSALTRFIGLPLSTNLNQLIQGLSNANGGGGPGSIFNIIKSFFLGGASSIGFQFGGQTSHPLFGSLSSGSILSAVESALGFDNLFPTLFDLIQSTILNPINLVNGVVQTVFAGVTEFSTLIQNQGFIGAFQSIASSIFSRKTLEDILNGGGIAAVLGSTARTLTTLITGEQAQELRISNSASIFFDLAGNFIGKIEDGILQVGTFGIDPLGKFALFAGKVIGTITGFSDLVFAGEVQNGQLYKGAITSAAGTIFEFNPEGGQGPIIIKGPDDDPQDESSGNFWSAVFNLALYGLKLFMKNGIASSAQIVIDSFPQGSADPTKPFYILANGIANPNLLPIKPDYVGNLESDLIQSSSGTITNRDLFSVPLYWWHPLYTLPPALSQQGFDILTLMLEAQSPGSQTYLTGLTNLWLGFHYSYHPEDRLRPTVAMGYSGGFIPLLEAILSEPYNVSGFVGLGAATAGLSEEKVSHFLDAVNEITNFATDALITHLNMLFSLGNPIIDFIMQAVSDRALDRAFDYLKQGIQQLVDELAPNTPDVSTTNANFLVNLWGTEDVLAEYGIGGYRDILGGFAAAPLSTKQLFNVEITGSDHFDYMRRSDADSWNLAVSDFVTKLLLEAKDRDTLQRFLDSDPRVRYNPDRKVYEVNP